MEDEIRGAGQELPHKRPHHLVAGVMKDHGETQLTVDELNTLGCPKIPSSCFTESAAPSPSDTEARPPVFSAGLGGASSNLRAPETIL